MHVRIPWAPRVILAGRVFRLPVEAPDSDVTLEADGFRTIASWWAPADSAVYYYLLAPMESGDYEVLARSKDEVGRVTVQVRTLQDLRRPHTFNEAQWPRRWPLGESSRSTKTRQTLQDMPRPDALDEDRVAWWITQTDEVVWRQLPLAELPRAHFTNVHQGCPSCGTAIFRHSGFYPWVRNHYPCDFRSTCPACGAVFPSNDIPSEDFISGDTADDGYGYTDGDGHLYLFAATYSRDQVRAFGAGIGILTDLLRVGSFDEIVARRLGLMLLRYAAETC